MDKEKRIMCTFRLNESTIEMLKELASVYKRNNTQLLELLIYSEYHKTTKVGKEKIEDINNQLNTLMVKLKELSINTQGGNDGKEENENQL